MFICKPLDLYEDNTQRDYWLIPCISLLLIHTIAACLAVMSTQTIVTLYTVQCLHTVYKFVLFSKPLVNVVL